MSYRSSRPEVFCIKGVLRNFAKFTGKHLSHRSLFFIKKETLAMVDAPGVTAFNIVSLQLFFYVINVLDSKLQSKIFALL